MKRLKWFFLLFASLFSLSLFSQNNDYGDDVYFTKGKEETAPAKKQDQPSDGYKDNRGNSVEVTATVPSDREIDEYNRRYTGNGSYEDQKLNSGDIQSDDSINNNYTERIIKFHDPSKITITGADNVNLYYDGNGYSLDFGQPDSYSVNFNFGWGWGWPYSYGYYNPWYSPFYYSSWYWPYDPWYASWYGGYYGWYDPWYSGWAWGGGWHHHGGWYGGDYYSNGRMPATRTLSSGVYNGRSVFGGSYSRLSNANNYGIRSVRSSGNNSYVNGSRYSYGSYANGRGSYTVRTERTDNDNYNSRTETRSYREPNYSRSNNGGSYSRSFSGFGGGFSRGGGASAGGGSRMGGRR